MSRRHTKLAALMVDVLTWLKRTIVQLIDAPPGIFSLRWFSLGMEIKGIIDGHVRENKILIGKEYPFEKEYDKAMAVMFGGLLKESKAVSDKLKKSPQDKEQLNEDVGQFLELLTEGIRQSPVVHYINWTGGKVNGLTFNEFTGELMGRMRQVGFGPLLSILDHIIALKNLMG